MDPLFVIHAHDVVSPFDGLTYFISFDNLIDLWQLPRDRCHDASSDRTQQLLLSCVGPHIVHVWPHPQGLYPFSPSRFLESQ